MTDTPEKLPPADRAAEAAEPSFERTDIKSDDDLLDEELSAELIAADRLIDELDPDLDVDVDEYADEAAAYAVDQTAPGEGVSFYEAGVDLHALDDLTLAGRLPVLERLGPAHFRSKGFSFMGFLQTVYDHVATEVDAKPNPVPSPGTPGEG